MLHASAQAHLENQQASQSPPHERCSPCKLTATPHQISRSVLLPLHHLQPPPPPTSTKTVTTVTSTTTHHLHTKPLPPHHLQNTTTATVLHLVQHFHDSPLSCASSTPYRYQKYTLYLSILFDSPTFLYLLSDPLSIRPNPSTKYIFQC
ncbi:hypothetical protein P8452_68830 [Trifolium repens]|nr:hypothetical protein P8452_68830 [Trifolium repens]